MFKPIQCIQGGPKVRNMPPVVFGFMAHFVNYTDYNIINAYCCHNEQMQQTIRIKNELQKLYHNATE